VPVWANELSGEVVSDETYSFDVPVECGCTLHPSHVKGDLLMRCEHHGQEYIVRAREVRSVEYTVTPAH
jgi:hypothetical protein